MNEKNSEIEKEKLTKKVAALENIMFSNTTKIPNVNENSNTDELSNVNELSNKYRKVFILDD